MTETPLFPDNPHDTQEPLERHNCQSCPWSGAAPVKMSAAERGAVLASLAPGDRVPSGRCPQCHGPTVPGPLAETDMAPDPVDPDDGALLPWTARVDRIGDMLVTQIQHPDGHGVEYALDIQGGKPTLYILPWNDPVGLEEIDPFVTLKAGRDHISLRHSGQKISRAVVCTPNTIQTSVPLSHTQWDQLTRWDDTPEMVANAQAPARSSR